MLEKMMQDFALLGDGDPEQLPDEQECLVTYMCKMTELQMKRKSKLSAVSNMAQIRSSMLLCR